jgi:Ca2+-binding EF-hand superfamily protein
MTEKPATLLTHSAMTNDQKQIDERLHAEALRIFDLAEKGNTGRLDMKDLSYVRNSQAMADTLLGRFLPAALHADSSEAAGPTIEDGLSDSISRSEWLAYFRKLAEEKNHALANQVLKLYAEEMTENNSIKRNFALNPAEVLADWPLRAEALRIFHLADKDGNGQLDMDELKDVRNNADMAAAMMRNLDTDLSGTLNEEEWLNYFYRLFLKNPKSAAAVLKLYEHQIKAPRVITMKKATTWEVIDSQQSTTLPGPRADS